MVDALNAEVSLGTVSNVRDAVQWLGYTYLFVRMRKNPLTYGMLDIIPILPLAYKNKQEYRETLSLMIRDLATSATSLPSSPHEDFRICK